MRKFFKRVFTITVLIYEASQLLEDYIRFVRNSSAELKKAGLNDKADKLVRRTKGIVERLRDVLPDRYL